MNFYEASVLEESERKLRQGDILYPVPFVVFSATEARILTPDAEELTTVDLTRTTDLPAETQLAANVGMTTGIVLNQSCDLSDPSGRGRPILIARVSLPERKRIKISSERTAQKNADEIRSMANPGKYPSRFYLPAHESTDFKMPKSVADFLEVTSFPPRNSAALSDLIRLRLSQPALQAFQERLTYCFGRFGAPDHLYMNEEEWEARKEQLARKGG